MKKRISSRSCKNKGAQFQKEVAKNISELIQIEFGENKCIQSRTMGCCGTDIMLIADAIKFYPWSVECKNDKSFNLKAWIRQSSNNIIKGTQWIVFFKKNHFKPVACMSSDVFDKIFNQHYLTCYIYDKNKWSLDRYITDARNLSNPWLIKLKYNDSYVSLLEMSDYFSLLSELKNDIKGLAI